MQNFTFKCQAVVCPATPSLIVRTMKLTLLFIFAAFMVQASGNAQSVTLSGKDLSFQKIFSEIKKQTGYLAFGNTELIESNKKLSVNVRNMPLRQFLDQVLKDQPFEYQIDDRTIFIMPRKRKPMPPGKTDGMSGDDTTAIVSATVRVTDADGLPLPGASVKMKRTRATGVTDSEGSLMLNVEMGDVIEVSFIGFVPGSYTIREYRSNYTIALRKSSSNLNEMVVVGYGSQKLGDITGAVATVSQKDIEKRAIGNASFDRALGGMAKGVLVFENNGIPGSAASINIRGFTSPFSGGSNQPLFVIDGVILNTDAQFNTGGETAFTVQSNPLLALDPNNIESISILKDAAATAIYGSRGANGVIIVNTKKGRRGEKPVVSLSYINTIGRPIGQLKPMNTQQFKDFTSLIINNTVNSVNNGEQPVSRLNSLIGTGLANIVRDPVTRKYTYNGLIPGFFGNENINWFDEIYRKNANSRQANLNIKGGTTATTYSFGGSYYDQDGVMINSDFRQYSFFMNINTALGKHITTGASLNLSSNKQESGNDPANDIRARFYLPARPDLPVYDDNGIPLRQPTVIPTSGYANANPVAKLRYQNVSKGQNLAGNAFVAAEPIKNLKLKAAFNLGAFLTQTDQFSPQIVQNKNPSFPPVESMLTVSEALLTNYITEVSADYGLKLSGAHRLNLTTGYVWDRTYVNRKYNLYMGFPDDQVLNNVSNAATALSFNEGSVLTGLNSIFARANYNFADRYLATINFRSDASSRFGPDNKRGYFPSISLGWNISNEQFFNRKGAVERVLLRLSAGKTGSSNISDFAYFQFFEKGFRDLGMYDGATAVGYSGTLPNLGISWETTYDYNAGIDVDLKNQWLTGTVDVYYRKTPNGIAATPFSLELGPASYSSNLVEMTNKGIEVGLKADVLRDSNGFNWTVNVNWALNRNKIKSLKNATISAINQDAYIEGQPLGTIKGYRTAGIFQSQEEVNALNAVAAEKYGTGVYYDQKATAPGDYKFVDQNGDGRVTTADRVVLGNIQPSYFGGIGNTFSYKGFELTAFFQFVKGSKASWANAVPTTTPLENSLAIFDNNTWTTENKAAKYPRVVYGNPGQSTRVSDQQIFEASYLRLKTLYLNYHFSKTITQRLQLADLALFISGANLFTISDWPGPDPGSLYSGTVSGRTQNRDPYPLSKSISFGLNAQF